MSNIFERIGRNSINFVMPAGKYYFGDPSKVVSDYATKKGDMKNQFKAGYYSYKGFHMFPRVHTGDIGVKEGIQFKAVGDEKVSFDIESYHFVVMQYSNCEIEPSPEYVREFKNNFMVRYDDSDCSLKVYDGMSVQYRRIILFEISF